MYLSIGNDRAVRDKSIIGIFDLDNASWAYKTREFLEQAETLPLSEETYRKFIENLKTARKLVFLTDNCGEIVMDKLLAETIHRLYPSLHITVLVRGGEGLNDATMEDAVGYGEGLTGEQILLQGVVDCCCDIDGELVVVHGPWLGEKNDPDRLNVQRSDLATLRSKRLKNGEAVPTLEEYLAEAATRPSLRLIIEVKDHATPQIETEVVRKVIALVKQHKLQDRVEYIAFRQHVCNEFVRLAPSGTPVMYLGSNLTPEYVKGLEYTGISYSVDALKRVPRWIDEAHRLGLKVCIWTVNCSADASWAVEHGVDYITTDNPAMVQKYTK